MVQVARRPYQQATSPPAALAVTANARGGGESAEEIQCKIEDLKRQIAQMDMQKQSMQQQQQQQAQPAATEGGEEEEYEEIVEEYVEEVTDEFSEEEIVEDSPIHHPSAPVRPAVTSAMPAAPPAPPCASSSPSHSQQQQQQQQHVAQPPSGGHHDTYRSQMDSLKQKYSFEKPNWAAPAEVVEKEEEIDRDSINNPLLKKAQMGGYVRQVKAKEIDLVKGTFVKESPQQKLEPRLSWIVVNINKRKCGKIVMHLYGRDVPRLVDQFVELKGYELQRLSSSLEVVGMDPALQVLATRVTKGLDSKSGVFGIIQEGHDVFQTLMSADANAVLTVKQAHIYPVVKGKKEFAKS